MVSLEVGQLKKRTITLSYIDFFSHGCYYCDSER